MAAIAVPTPPRHRILLSEPHGPKPRYLLFTPKKVWWLLVLDVHPPWCMENCGLSIPLWLDYPPVTTHGKKSPIDKPDSHSNSHWCVDFLASCLMTRGTLMAFGPTTRSLGRRPPLIRLVPGSQTALHRIARSGNLRPRRVVTTRKIEKSHRNSDNYVI